MGLLLKLGNGDTAFKSLRYGNDRPGGGDSGQPFIKSPIPDNSKDSSAFDIDGFIRGGVLAPVEAATDVARLSKYFFNTKNPSGLLFTAKQNLLSRVAPKTEATKGPAYLMGTVNDGIYSPTSTIAQAGVGFLGTHLNKQGLDPTGLIPGLRVNKYEKVASKNNEAKNNSDFKKTFENRLLKLWNSKIKTEQTPKDSEIIRKYGGGPGSKLGIGKTKIKFSTTTNFETGLKVASRTGINNKIYRKTPDGTGRNFSLGFFFEGDELTLSQQDIDEKYKTEKVYEDNFLFNTRDTGDAGTDLSRSTIINKINALPPVTNQLYSSGENGLGYSVNTIRNLEGKLGDFVEFTIALQPGDDESQKTYLQFPAFIDSYNEDFSADYKNIQYMGRPEPFYIYQGFKRGINLSFTVAAQSREEIGNMYTKLNYLASSIAPSYTSAGYMTGNLAYLTVGDICRNKPGIIEGFSFNIPEEASWDIGQEDTSTRTTSGKKMAGPQMAMMIKVTGFKFTPLYEDKPEWGTSAWFGNKAIFDTTTSYKPTKTFRKSSDAFNEPPIPTLGVNPNINNTLPTTLQTRETTAFAEGQELINRRTTTPNSSTPNDVLGTSDGRRISSRTFAGADFNQNPFVNYNF